MRAELTEGQVKALDCLSGPVNYSRAIFETTATVVLT